MGNVETEFGEMLKTMKRAKKRIGAFIEATLRNGNADAIALCFQSEANDLVNGFSSKAWAVLALKHLGIFMTSMINSAHHVESTASGLKELSWEVVKAIETNIARDALSGTKNLSSMLVMKLISKEECSTINWFHDSGVPAATKGFERLCPNGIEERYRVLRHHDV